MHIGTTGIVTNEYNNILLIMRDDTRTWCAPGGSLDEGELPTDGTAREVKEETGMYTLPIRLVSADYWPTSSGTLHLTFRCLIRGGKPTPSAESPQVGFFPFKELPQPMLSIHSERLELARDHVGAPVLMTQKIPLHLIPVRLGLTLFVYPFKNARRWWRGEPAYQPPASWQLRIVVATADDNGRLHLDNGRLPQKECPNKTAPWDVAVSLAKQTPFTKLAGLYVTKETKQMTLLFANEAAYQAELPDNLADTDVALLQDMRLDPDNTRVAYMP